MTLRFDDRGRPVGLDWSVCNDGKSRPDLWETLPKAKTPSTSKVRSLTGRGRKTMEPAVVRSVIELYRDNYSAVQIATQLGIASSSVFKVLRDNNVPTRSKSEGMRLRRERSA